jgi:hypothetical protein
MELNRKQKTQNLLFILLNLFLVILGLCFITIKVKDSKLICLIIFLLYCLLGYCFCLNLIEYKEINNKKE